MRVLLPLLLLGLAACYSPRTITPEPRHGPYGELYEEPLRASLWVDPFTSHAAFELNRPAHVAIFAWRPGQHMEMIQPAIGQQMRQHFTAGSHSLWTRSGHQRATRTAYARLAGGAASPGPVYYMLIASAEPLHVAPFLGTARMHWAHQVTWSQNLYTATELLATQIIPDIERTEWTVAYHMGWSDDGWDEAMLRVPPRSLYRWVYCPGGIVLSVPVDVWERGWMLCPEVDPGPTPPMIPPDTTTDVERRPEDLPRRPFRPEATDADRPDAQEFRNLLRQILAARGRSTDDVSAPPLPAWRRTDRDVAPAGPVVRPSTRPAVQPAAASAHPASDTRASAPGATRSTPPAARPGVPGTPPATRTEPAARPAERTRPEAQRPRPQAERPTPAVQRPTPQTTRPRPSPKEDPRGG